jgi:hypothetical protein
VKSETEIQQPDWPNLKLEDLLVDAPKETKDAISQLKSPIADCDNLQVPVSVPSEVSTKLVEVDSLQNKITDERDSLRNDSNSADTLRQKLEKKNWAPNPLKTKRFVDRLIYTNALQLDRKTNWFPSCGTITGGIGYQVSKKSSVGIGLHYSIALDNVEEKKGEIALNKRKLLSNGYGGRAFADLLLLKSIYLQGSYELSQRAYAYDIQISELVPHHSLQPSCLVDFI